MCGLNCAKQVRKRLSILTALSGATKGTCSLMGPTFNITCGVNLANTRGSVEAHVDRFDVCAFERTAGQERDDKGRSNI